MTRLIKSQLTDIFARKYPVYYTKNTPVYIHMHKFAPEFVPVEANSRARSVGVGMACLDFVDLRAFFDQRTLVMKTVPVCLRGAFRAALRRLRSFFEDERHTMQPGTHGRKTNFMFLPRMLFCRSRRGGHFRGKQPSRHPSISSHRLAQAAGT